MYNQQNTLPVSAEQAMNNDWNLGNGIPVNYAAPQHLAAMSNLMPLIVSQIVSVAQQTKINNHFRMFFFNMLSQQNYNNNLMGNIVSVVTEYAATRLYSGNGANEQMIVQQAVNDVLECSTLLMVQTYPALQAYFNNQINQNNVFQANAKYNNIQQQINQFNMQMNNMPGQRVGGGMVNNNVPMPGNVMQPNNNSMTGAINANILTRPSVGGGNVNNEIAGIADRFGGRAAPVQKQTIIVEPPTTVTTTVNEEIEWKPSEQYRYYPAVDSVASKVTLTNVNGVVTPVITSKERNPMDFAKHSMGNAFGNLVNPGILPAVRSKGLSVLDADIVDIDTAASLAVSKEKPITDFTDTVDPFWVIECSLDAGWMTTSSRLQAKRIQNKSRKTAMLRTYVCVPSVIYLDQESYDTDHPFIEVIRNEKMTFIELQNYMQHKAKHVSVGTYTHVNRRLTQFINNRLLSEFGLADTIDSFADDYKDLIEFLENEYGYTVVNKFIENDTWLVSSIFNNDFTSAVKDMVAVSDEANPEKESTVPLHVYLSHNYSLTQLSLCANELTIDFKPNLPCQLFPSENVELHSLAESLFSSQIDINQNVETHLVRLQDGYILKITRSPYDKNTYMVSLVSK